MTYDRESDFGCTKSIIYFAAKLNNFVEKTNRMPVF